MMLRIELEDQVETVTIHVEGKLVGDCVDELRRVWTTLRCQCPEKQTIVDLSSVLIADCSARQLLCQMHTWGARLTGSGLVIGPLIHEITKNN